MIFVWLMIAFLCSCIFISQIDDICLIDTLFCFSVVFFFCVLIRPQHGRGGGGGGGIDTSISVSFINVTFPRK